MTFSAQIRPKRTSNPTEVERPKKDGGENGEEFKVGR